LLFAVSSAFSQNGKIILSSQPENPDGQATFRYEAPEGVNMPDDIQANVSCSDIRILSIPLEKKGSGYEFSLKLPESSTVLFFSITDKKQNVLDNNSGKGFVTYLKDPSGEGGELVLFEKIQSAGMAAYFLKLDYEEQDMLNEYETFFETYPDLKNESVYAPCLMLKFRKNKETLRPELIDFAEKMAAREDEKSLSAAYSIFRSLDLHDEMDAVAKKALEKYPRWRNCQI
jgi:hypothetical protein